MTSPTKGKPWKNLSLRQIFPPPQNEFIDNEATVSDDGNNSADEKSIDGSDISSLLSDSNLRSPGDSDRNFYRRIDNGNNSKPKAECRHCGKQISRDHRARHERGCSGKTNCQYCGIRMKKDLYKDHLEKGCKECKYCKWCEKVFENENFPPDHRYQCEVSWRLEDLRKKGEEKKLKDLQEEALKKLNEYEEYKKICKEKGFFPRKIERWLKENKKCEQNLIDIVLMESKGKNSDEILKNDNSTTKKDNPIFKKPRSAPPKKKKKPDPEDEETEMQKTKKRKPGTIFQATFSLPLVWVYQTLLLLIKKINCGYFISQRRKAGWRFRRFTTSLFPESPNWSWHQTKSLQKKTPLRKILRDQVKRIVRNTHLAYFNWKHYREFLGTVSSINIWKNFFRRRWIPGINVFQEYVFSSERGLDADPHCHAFFRTKDKMYINKLRMFFRRFKVNGKSILRDIEPCKSAKTYLRYITKEDYKAIVYNVDKEALHDNYIMFNFAKQSQLVHPGQYAWYRWRTQSQLRKYLEIHDWYWKNKQNMEDYELAMKHVHLDTLKMCQNTDRKGIYLYGAPGTGKSTVAFALSKGNFYMVTEHSKFAFHAWHGEENLLFEDFAIEQLLKFRLQINQLTDMYGKTTVERKGANHVRVSCKRVIVTSNSSPPTEEQWPGFQRRFLIVYFQKNE